MSCVLLVYFSLNDPQEVYNICMCVLCLIYFICTFVNSKPEQKFSQNQTSTLWKKNQNKDTNIGIFTHQSVISSCGVLTTARSFSQWPPAVKGNKETAWWKHVEIIGWSLKHIYPSTLFMPLSTSTLQFTGKYSAFYLSAVISQLYSLATLQI